MDEGRENERMIHGEEYITGSREERREREMETVARTQGKGRKGWRDPLEKGEMEVCRELKKG